MNAYEQKRQNRIDRLHTAAERKRQEAAGHKATADKMGSVIPFGQPILIGHHSEGADRRYRTRMHGHMQKWIDKIGDAQDLERKAEAAANNRAIFSDDPAAVEKITDKVARLQERQDIMKAANKLVRKKDRAGLVEIGFTEDVIDGLLTPDFAGRLGFASYRLKNNNANIRRLKKRVAKIQTHAADVTTETEHGNITIIDNVEDNRLQVFFPGKPSADIRKRLKSHGFRWAPSIGAWQRHRSNQATYWAEQIVS